MAQHKLFTPVRGMAALRETRSNSHGAVPRTALLCERPHVLFNIALLYSGDRFEAGSAFSGVTA